MISVLIPTKGRPEKLARCIASIDANCEILILAHSQSDVPLSVSQDSRVIIFFDSNMMPVEACNYLASMAEGHLLPTGDDVEYLPNALQIAEFELDSMFGGCGVIGMSVINMDCNDDAFMLVGRSFYNDVLGEELFHKEYQHFYADTELGRLAKKLNRFIPCKEAQMINYHPSSGCKADATHSEGRLEKIEHDRKIYEARCQSSLS